MKVQLQQEHAALLNVTVSIGCCFGIGREGIYFPHCFSHIHVNGTQD